MVEQLDSDRFRLSTAVDDSEGACVVGGEAVVISDPMPEQAADEDRVAED